MLSFLIIFISCYVYWKWYTRPLPNEPPMLPGAWPFIGHAHLLLGDTKNLWQFVKNLAIKSMELGHSSYFYTGPLKFYVITDPDDIYKVSNICYDKDQFSSEFTKTLLGNGILFSPATTWHKHRKLINPTFNQQILDGYMDIFNNQGKKLAKKLQAEIGKGYFYPTEYIQLNSMETICLTAIDESITEDDALKFAKLVELYMNLIVSRFQRIWLYPDIIFKYSSLKQKTDKCIGMINEISFAVLRKKRALKKLEMDKGVSDTQTKSKVKVFMDLLMELDNGTLSDQEIRDELNTIMMSGQETVGTSFEIILIMIGSYPEVQERVYKELQEVLQDRDVEKQDLSRLVYLEAVIKESLRYYVVVPFVGRYIDRDVQLKNCTLKSGNNCAMLLYGVQRNPQWGPDVNDFKPERWLDPATMPKNHYVHTAFSYGKRNCIGKNYAMMSLKTGLSHVLRRYKLQADHTKLVAKFDFLLKPDSGHMISIEDRLAKP